MSPLKLAKLDQVGKVFLVVDGMRKCLVCEAVLKQNQAAKRDDPLQSVGRTSAGSQMQIGEPLRSILIEPLEVPGEPSGAIPQYSAHTDASAGADTVISLPYLTLFNMANRRLPIVAVG